jgi:hypothetical protein
MRKIGSILMADAVRAQLDASVVESEIKELAANAGLRVLQCAVLACLAAMSCVS